jgi:ferredoxin-NADP reductase
MDDVPGNSVKSLHFSNTWHISFLLAIIRTVVIVVVSQTGNRMMKLIAVSCFAGFSWIGVDAFAPLSQRRCPLLVDSCSSTSRGSRLQAEGGPPQYAKHMGVLKEAEIVGDGSVMLHIERVAAVGGSVDENPLEYEPGHVLALEIQGPTENSETNNDEGIKLDEKTIKDMEQNEGWMRGPYTITRCKDNSFDILIKVVGAKSKVMASAAPGTPIRFGGKFHVPIVEGISPASERIVMISTGVGVGPCVGAIEKLLSENFTGAIDLFASYRHEEDELFGDYLNVWAATYGNFRYRPVITSDIGRLSSSEANVGLVVNEDICSLSATHYHLIGNGQMVAEWRAGLSNAGVPKERITVESYFNHKSPPSEVAIETIATVIREAALSPAPLLQR